MKTAIDSLITEGRSRGCSQFKLDIRKKPGLDTTAMQAQLDAYIDWLKQQGEILSGENAYVIIQDYEFIPAE